MAKAHTLERKKNQQCHAECKSSFVGLTNMTAAIILAYIVHKCGIAIIQRILTRVKMRNSAHEEK